MPSASHHTNDFKRSQGVPGVGSVSGCEPVGVIAGEGEEGGETTINGVCVGRAVTVGTAGLGRSVGVDVGI